MARLAIVSLLISTLLCSRVPVADKDGWSAFAGMVHAYMVRADEEALAQAPARELTRIKSFADLENEEKEAEKREKDEKK